MTFNFSDIGAYLSTGRAAQALIAILRAGTRVFDFGVERANRLRRFMLVIRDYARGDKVQDIADRYECSRGTVMRHARIAGLAKRDKSPVPGRKAGILADYVAGEPVQKIADKYDVAPSRVSQIAKEAGVLRRRFK